MKPIAIQLYSLREESARDFPAVLRRVADIGYRGVEPAGFHGLTPKEFRALVDDLGLTVSSNHGPWPTLDNLDEVVEVAGVLGTDLVVCGWGPEHFASRDALRRTAETANAMTERLAAAGLTLALHNHWWEFETLDGALVYDLFLDLCPRLRCEIDLYWAANFGALDPAAVVARHKARTPLLHVKDGPLERDQAHLAVGAGRMDIPAALRAADPDVLRWLVVELDRCDTDMLEAVARSYEYLVGGGYALGNRSVGPS